MTPDKSISASTPRSRSLRLLLLVIAMPLFMTSLDQMIVIVAVPEMAKAFERLPPEMSPVFSFSMQAMLTAIPLAGWLTERYGAKRLFLTSLVLFGAGSLACALADDLAQLAAGRILQGIGAGLTMPVARILLQMNVPRNSLVTAIAWYSTAAVLGPVIGPGLGGLLLQLGTWPLIFYINIPVVAITITLGLRVLGRDEPAAMPRRFDLWGYLLLVAAIFLLIGGLQLIAEQGSNRSQHLLGGTGVVASLVLWTAYTFHARRVSAPLIALRILSDDIYRRILLSGSLFRIGTSALPLICSISMQVDHGLGAQATGLLLSCLAGGALLAKPGTPFVLNRLGYRAVLWLDVAGSAVTAALLAVLFAGHDLDVWLVGCVLVLSGICRSLHFTALNSLSFHTIRPEELANATTLATLAQNLTIGLGIVLAGLLLTSLEGTADVSFRVLLGFAAVIMASACFFLRLPANIGGDMLRPPR